MVYCSFLYFLSSNYLFSKEEWLIFGLKISFLLFVLFTGFEDKRNRKIPNTVNFLLLTLSSFTFCLIFLIKGHIDKLGFTVGLFSGICFFVKTKIIGGGDFKVLLATSLVFPILTFYSLILSMILTILKVRGKAYHPLIFYFSIFITIFFLFRHLCTG